ncbi:MAG: hypothetical protein ACLUI3_00725 [Christensenellales bacterium]
MEPATTQKLFDRIDCSAGDFQYVVLEGTTYLFWIQPGMGPNDWGGSTGVIWRRPSAGRWAG